MMVLACGRVQRIFTKQWKCLHPAACHPMNFIVKSSISNFRATRLPLGTQKLGLSSPKPRELIWTLEALDSITLLDLPASNVIS